jgi:hypothetical protein
MTTKRQQTMAKITRERAVKEKRERKLEKKRAAKAERKAMAELGIDPWAVTDEADPTGDDGAEPTVDPAASDSDALLDPHETDGDDGPVLGERVVTGL